MPKDITGQIFGRLTAIKPTDEVRNGTRMWLCQCECGTKKRIRQASLIGGFTKSCGCLRQERKNDNLRTHGDTNSREYTTWDAMKRRCYTTTNRDYPQYGGRGIKVCTRWCNSYENFLADMGRRPTPQHSIDRVNNDGNYTRKNCRWVTRKEQATNRRTTVRVDIGGETRTLSEWLTHFNVKRRTYEMRVSRGYSRVEALTKVRYQHRKRSA